MKHFRRCGTFTTVATLFCLIQSTPSGAQEDLRTELSELVDQEDRAFLLDTIQQVQPTIILRRLASLQRSHNISDGGICGLQPNQSVELELLPIATERISDIEAAEALARQRYINHHTLMDLGFPVEFSNTRPPPPTSWPPKNMKLTIDWTAPMAFLAALEDGEVTAAETTEIVELPANIELLRSYARQNGVSSSPITRDDLVFFISRSSSSDPFDRLCCWLNPMHHFGYADLVVNAAQYRWALGELQDHNEAISDAVLARIAPFLPPDTKVHSSVALSVCCPMSTWATSRMVGVNIEHIKGDWEHLVRVLSAAVFDHLQEQLRLEDTDSEPLTGDDLAGTLSTVSRHKILERALTMAAFKGAADYVSDQGAQDEGKCAVQLGAALLHSYATVDTTNETSLSIENLPLEEEIISCSMRALGRHLTRVITAYDGPQAITELIQRGPAAFFLRAAEIESAHGRHPLSQETISVIRDLASRS